MGFGIWRLAIELTGVWFGMMAAMMAPVVFPWILAFDRFGAGRPASIGRALSTISFAGGYLVAWLSWAIAAAQLQMLLMRLGNTDAMHEVAPTAGATILMVAGAYQFAPLKRACLTHCRNPLTYYLTRWRDGVFGGFRMGLGHGVYCVGCCWALMATALAAGMMNLWWMASLAVVAFVEQVVPRGDLIRVPLGVALVIAGVVRLTA